MMWARKKLPPTTDWQVPLKPVEYPVGTCVKTPKGTFLISRDGKKYRIPSQAILDSWNFPLVVVTTAVAVSEYPTALTKLPFRDGTLLNNVADGRMYLVSDKRLRHITDPNFFDRMGKKPTDCIVVSDADIQTMKLGDKIT